jgi:hypothetical protein
VLGFEKIFNFKVGIALKLPPIFVAGHQRYLFDWQSCLEQAARPFVAQIVKVKIFDFEFDAPPSECCTYGSVVMRENPSMASSHNSLLKHDLPGIISR